MTATKMRKFYDDVSVEKMEDGWCLLLDGKEVQSPAKDGLRVSNQALADAISEEWRMQGEDIDLEKMPNTRMSFGAMDISNEEVTNLQVHIAGYAETDLLCYRVSADQDKILSQRQNAAWSPWLTWAEKTCDLSFDVTEGIMPIEQAEETMASVRKRVVMLSQWELVPMGILTGQLGSYVLAEALREGALDIEQAIAASFLDDDYQIEKWGADEEAELKHKNAKAEIRHVAAFLRLVGLD